MADDFTVSMDIHGTRAFQQFADRIDGLMDSFLLESAEFFRREATLRDEEGGRMPYDTGTLQGSIAVNPPVRRSGPIRYVTISTNVHYAAHQEYGFYPRLPGESVRQWKRLIASGERKRVPGKGFFRFAQDQTANYMTEEWPSRLRALAREVGVL